jgi:hypothetical protein
MAKELAGRFDQVAAQDIVVVFAPEMEHEAIREVP